MTVLVTFFYFLTLFFDLGPVFLGRTQTTEEKQLHIQMQTFFLNLFKKKVFENKSLY